MANTQKPQLRFDEPLRRPTVLEEPQEGQSVEPSTPPPVKVLDGKVTRKGELAFAGGTYCEVWVGLWDKGGGEEAGRDKADGEKEKVSSGLTPVILLTLLFVGGLESTSSTKVVREGAQGLTFPDHFCVLFTHVSLHGC